MSNGFAFNLVWNVLENGYLEPHNVSRIDFNKERGRVSMKHFFSQNSFHFWLTNDAIIFFLARRHPFFIKTSFLWLQMSN